jgi:hypothetical protein
VTNSLPATLTVNPGAAATNGYITAVLRSGCASSPTPPPPVGYTNIGPDYVMVTVADADPRNFSLAQQLVTDGVFESIMPLYCALPPSTNGCVTDTVQWNIITYDANGNPVTSGCAASGCQFRSCSPPPTLKVQNSPAKVAIMWPGTASNYVLEMSTDLVNWSPVATTSSNGVQSLAPGSASGASVFFRLRHK